MNADVRRAMLVAEVEDLTAAIEDRGLWVSGSKGQDILNPALAARRAALEAIRHLDASAPPAPASDPLGDFLAGFAS